MLQKRCDNEQNDLLFLRWKFWICCVKTTAHPAWVFVTTSGFRKQSTRRGEWRKGGRVTPSSKVPGCDWDKSLVMERDSKAAL